MKHGAKKLFERLTAILTLALFISGMAAADESVYSLSVPPIPKDSVAWDDVDGMVSNQRKSNVLFLIEATSIMSFTPKGVLPQVAMVSGWDDSFREAAHWGNTRKKYEYTIYDINRMMKDATFGMGALPVAWSGKNVRPERNIYGRDRDAANNFVKGRSLSEDIELNEGNYYFPFLDENNALSGIYREQSYPLEVSFDKAPDIAPFNTLQPSDETYNKPAGDESSLIADSAFSSWSHHYGATGSLSPGYIGAVQNPKTGAIVAVNSGIRYNGNEIVKYYDYKGYTAGAKPYPYALVYEDPRYWSEEGGRNAPSDAKLVPNDSRMYQTKLVLWNLLRDKSLFKNIRFGMATTFLSPANTELGTNSVTHSSVLLNRPDKNGVFKVAPFGSNIYTLSFFDKDGNSYANHPDKHLEALLNDPEKKRVRYENGVMEGSITGELETMSAVHGQYYPIWNNLKVQSTYLTVNRDGTEPDGWWSPHWDYPSKNVPSSYPLHGEQFDRPLYKLMNRASLWLPIREYDDIWTKGGVTMSHADKFRMWINGVADIKSAGVTKTTGLDLATYGLVTRLRDGFGLDRRKQFHFYRDPEIGIAGQFALPQAIFPDPRVNDKSTGKPLNLNREYMHENGFVWYSKKDQDINYMYDFRRFSSELDVSGFPKAFFNAGSGEAAGSVIDFFSPMIGYSFTGNDYDNVMYPHAAGHGHARSGASHVGPFAINGKKYGRSGIYDSNKSSTISTDDLDDVSFPIRNACEKNWVILIASGSEARTGDGEYSYRVADAIKNLYDYAENNDVTMLEKSGGVRILKQGRLQHPIRTLVIGIVADENNPDVAGNEQVKEEVMRMRKNLVRMARAGQGDDPDDESSTVRPYFATDVESLMMSLREALTMIDEREEQPSSGAIVESPSVSGLDEAEDSFSYYVSKLRIRRNNQWEGYLTRFAVSEDEDGGLSASKRWELHKNIAEKRDDNIKRKIEYWSGDGLRDLTPDDAFKRMSGLTPERLSDANMPTDDSFSVHAPERAMFDWLEGFDYSYSDGKGYPRSSMFADVGQGGIVYVDNPQPADSLPGYRDWANGLQPSRPRIYAQTNDGILHVIDPASGNEERAILPPPMLLPYRLAAFKTRKRSSGELQWIDVSGAEGKGIALPRSVPLYTLDGPLIKRSFGSPDGGSWGTYLLGGLGRGGSGFYMLNTDKCDSPEFMWYRERIGDYALSMTSGQTEPTVVKGGDPYFMKLGFNPPKPALGVTGSVSATRNVLVVAGGAQNRIDLAKNGGEGAVLLILDPMNGELLKGFDSADVEHGLGTKTPGPAPNMGMMTSEPTLVRSRASAYLAGRIIASDNRGGIFSVDLEETDGDGTKPKPVSSWSVRTLATLWSSESEAGSKADNLALPFGLAAGSHNGRLWLGGGTSDVRVRKEDESPGSGFLRNAEQMIFAFAADESQVKPYTRNDMKPLNSHDGGESVLTDADEKRGWYIKLLGENGRGNEYVSAKPIIVNGILYVATFVERSIDWENIDVCESGTRVTGDARLYAVDVTSGAPYWRDCGKYARMDGARITGLTFSTIGRKKRIVMTYDKMSEDDAEVGLEAPGSEFLKSMGVFVLEPPDTGSPININETQNVIQYWLRK
ncbi:MAG: pilus assembly protein [Synergistaceae bacterium]|nr:pilus assembly protein [Synergistaceae bacterium]